MWVHQCVRHYILKKSRRSSPSLSVQMTAGDHMLHQNGSEGRDILDSLEVQSTYMEDLNNFYDADPLDRRV